jgi:serine/threonine-protein kinase RsbW
MSLPSHLSLDLTLPTEHTYVRTTRRALGGYLDDAGVPAPLRDDLVLAIGEACTNVVQHAFPDGDGTLRLRLELRAGEVVVEVSDSGVGFEPFEQINHARGRMAVNGRGIEIMRRLVGEVEVESPPTGGTRIRLRQRIPADRLTASGVGS